MSIILFFVFVLACYAMGILLCALYFCLFYCYEEYTGNGSEVSNEDGITDAVNVNILPEIELTNHL